jgi:hypothetical protein
LIFFAFSIISGCEFLDLDICLLSLKISIKNQIKKTAISGLKLKVKVYTGKKYKTYNTKTNKNGVAKINTKILKRGTHKVVISSGNSNYKISAKSTIKIK